MDEHEYFWKDFSVNKIYIDEIMRIYSLEKRSTAKRKLWYANQKISNFNNYTTFYFADTELLLKIAIDLKIILKLDFTKDDVKVIYNKKTYESKILSVALFMFLVDYL